MVTESEPGVVVIVMFAPATSVKDGVGRFVAWYRGYYGV